MKVIDSNIIIYSTLPEQAKLRDLFDEEGICCSIISKIEVLGFKSINKEEITYYNSVFNNILSIPMNDAIIESAVLLKQQKKMSLGDSIIAATALVYDCALFTANTEDFKNIKGLKLVNPIKL
jgi:predicted nucleic acid-binding protein